MFFIWLIKILCYLQPSAGHWFQDTFGAFSKVAPLSCSMSWSTRRSPSIVTLSPSTATSAPWWPRTGNPCSHRCCWHCAAWWCDQTFAVGVFLNLLVCLLPDQVCVEGRLYLEFMFDDMMRIKTWHFSIRQHREILPRSILAMHVRSRCTSPF